MRPRLIAANEGAHFALHRHMVGAFNTFPYYGARRRGHHAHAAQPAAAAGGKAGARMGATLWCTMRCSMQCTVQCSMQCSMQYTK